MARSLERVGEWWSILILRDALRGLSRFDEFQSSLGIASNVLSSRLSAMVEHGLLERRLYSERPPRHEYFPTETGRDFMPVAAALLAWGNRHFAPDGEAAVLVDRKTGRKLDPVMVDRETLMPVSADTAAFAAGPAAGPRIHERTARAGR